jgi:hypothetical protein
MFYTVEIKLEIESEKCHFLINYTMNKDKLLIALQKEYEDYNKDYCTDKGDGFVKGFY